MVKVRLPPRDYDGLSTLVDWEGMRDIRYALFVIGCVLIGLGSEQTHLSAVPKSTDIFTAVFNPLFYVQTYAAVNKYPTDITTYILSITYAGSMFGRFVPGFLGDRLGV